MIESSEHRRSEGWFSAGYSSYLAADVVWQRLHPESDAWEPDVPLTADHVLTLRLRGAFAILAAMAIENLLKGVIARAGGTPPKTHDLLALSQEAERTWNAAEVDLLERLATFIEWADRVGTEQSRVLKSTDHQTFVEITRRLFDVHLGGINI